VAAGRGRDRPGDAPAFDDMATWTGSTVQNTDGTWFMFNTGSSSTDRGLKQRIGIATSDDLYSAGFPSGSAYWRRGDRPGSGRRANSEHGRATLTTAEQNLRDFPD